MVFDSREYQGQLAATAERLRVLAELITDYPGETTRIAAVLKLGLTLGPITDCEHAEQLRRMVDPD
jgi:hypothetical protein